MLLSFASSEIFHGMGIQMTNNGTGVYYKPGLELNKFSQIVSDIGFHFDTPFRIMNYHGSNYQNRSISMLLLTGYRRELLKDNIVGTFHPVLSFQGGSCLEINKLSWNNISGSIFIYTLGIGFQFYNVRVLNEILFKINQLLSEERTLSFQLSIYWK